MLWLILVLFFIIASLCIVGTSSTSTPIVVKPPATDVDKTTIYTSVPGIQQSDCPVERKPRRDNVNDPFSTSNGTLNWLTTHPSYYFKNYHGYYPWSTDDYSPYSPFDVTHPYFFLN